jgi:hypothetical protein
MGISLSSNTQSSVQRIPTAQTFTTAGSVPAGAKSVSVANIGTKVGTVLGTNIPVGATLTYDAPPNDTLGAIAYDPTKDASAAVTGTTFIITTLT